jgi:predicted RNA-binding Zn ribbon-like protein
MPPAFELIAGNACLDFVNTVSGDRFHAPKEKLTSYGDFVAFARQAGLIDGAAARALHERAGREPLAAGRALERALELREALFRIFWGMGSDDDRAGRGGRKPAPGDLALLNRALGEGLAHREVVARSGSYQLGWGASDDLDRPLWPLAAAAADLLADPDRAPIRMCGLCEEHECTWIFLDETKNRSRRWCSMKDCGNRAKARRHYERARST